jgi:hypothetical protein
MGMTSAERRGRPRRDCLRGGRGGSRVESCSGSPSASASVRMNPTTWSTLTPARQARRSTRTSTGSLSRTNRLSQGRTRPAMGMKGCIPVASEIRSSEGPETAAGLRMARNPASKFGGAEGSRTPDPKTASLVLSQLSYSPTRAPRYRPVAGIVKEGRKGSKAGRLVPGAGVEPARPYGHSILNRARLPLRHPGAILRCRSDADCTTSRSSGAPRIHRKRSRAAEEIFRR